MPWKYCYNIILMKIFWGKRRQRRENDEFLFHFKLAFFGHILKKITYSFSVTCPFLLVHGVNQPSMFGRNNNSMSIPHRHITNLNEGLTSYLDHRQLLRKVIIKFILHLIQNFGVGY